LIKTSMRGSCLAICAATRFIRQACEICIMNGVSQPPPSLA
jgi:hypothetical protein